MPFLQDIYTVPFSSLKSFNSQDSITLIFDSFFALSLINDSNSG